MKWFGLKGGAAICLCFVATSVTGQVLKGKVSDKSNGETLIGVNIFNQDNVGVSSDLDGAYNLKLPPGEQTITFKFIGYQQIQKSFVLIDGETIEFNAKLSVESTTFD